MKKVQIGVVGGRQVSNQILDFAFHTGQEIAKRDAVLVCGGMGGVMEAACKGAKEKGGLTVGILPTVHAQDANSFVDVIIPTGMGLARNALIVSASDGIVAIGGKYGTLSEMAFAKQMDKPLISLQSWTFDSTYPQVQSPQEAVRLLFDMLLK